MASITVDAKVIGQRRPLVADWQLDLPPDSGPAGGRLTLRDLITRVVQAEVAAFQERREQRRFTQVLTRDEIQEGAARGKVTMGGRDEEPDVDPEEAVATALLGFQDGLYYVFIDDEQVTQLDREVYLRPDSRMQFLRLVALAGG